MRLGYNITRQRAPYTHSQIWCSVTADNAETGAYLAAMHFHLSSIVKQGSPESKVGDSCGTSRAPCHQTRAHGQPASHNHTLIEVHPSLKSCLMHANNSPALVCIWQTMQARCILDGRHRDNPATPIARYNQLHI